ncbi:MAG: hypothetical protein PHG10_07420 [Sulfurimonas sp.]|nr:hypothetical protein [Sulfurimonas sp.]
MKRVFYNGGIISIELTISNDDTTHKNPTYSLFENVEPSYLRYLELLRLEVYYTKRILDFI